MDDAVKVAPGATPSHSGAAMAAGITLHPAAVVRQRSSAAAVRPDHQLVLYWLLRVAAGLEFVGHGAFGVITKAAWVPYFDLVGIPERWAYRLMPVVGSVDIFMGFVVLFKPVRAALLYMAVWRLCTALLRPLYGERLWETVDRAPN